MTAATDYRPRHDWEAVSVSRMVISERLLTVGRSPQYVGRHRVPTGSEAIAEFVAAVNRAFRPGSVS